MSERGKINLIIFQTLIFSLLFALFGRLFYLQVLDSGRYQDAALSIQSRDIVTPAVRGAITDIHGSPLVVDLPGLVVFADRSTLDKQEDKGVSVLSRTANLFALEYSDIYQRTRLCGELPKDNRAGCWNGTRYQPIPLVGNANQDLALKVLENSDLYPGIQVQTVPIRSYPSLEGENVAHVLGYVGAVTDEDLKNPDKNYYRNEVVGKAGLEVKYDEFLRGTPGVRTFLVNRKEVVTKEAKNIKAVAGNNLITNIESKLQSSAEQALSSAISRARASGYRGDSGAAIVMEIKTGRVLA
ncbi:MAG: penicillin-binding protein 2, partial [Actinobacteria bacterium]|nr:penicillin-binding protein 2 [Actinomycetota bacterium]